MSIIGNIRDKIPLKGLAKWALAFAPLAIVGGQWWGTVGGSRNYKEVFGNQKVKNIAINLPEDRLQSYVDDAQKYYRYITLVYAYGEKRDKDGNLILNDSIFSPAAKAFIGDELKNCELLEFKEKLSGLKVIFTRDKVTGEKILSICGAQITPNEKFVEDRYDAFYSAAGHLTEQFPDLFKLVKNLEEKYGRIDVVSGQSLGGHLATSLVPELPGAKIFAYDSPGLSHNQLFQLQKFYSNELGRNVSKKEIKDQFRDGNYIRVIIGENGYNTIGAAGACLTMTDPRYDDYRPFSPIKVLDDHFHNTAAGRDNFFSHISKSKEEIRFYNADQSVYSGAPLGATAIMALIPLSLFLAPKIKRKFNEELRKYEDRNPPTPDSSILYATSIRQPFSLYPLPQYSNTTKLGFNGHNNRIMHK
jgi:hypothetical protein